MLLGPRPGSPDHPLDPFVERAAVEQDLAPADLAFEPDIGADTHHAPLVAAARVGFAQPHQVIHLDLFAHSSLSSDPGACR